MLRDTSYVLTKLDCLREQGIWPNGLRYLWTDAFGGCCQPNSDSSPIDAAIAVMERFQAASKCHLAKAAERRVR